MQMHRVLHADSTYASLLLLGQTMGLTQVSIQTVGTTPLSVNVVSPLAGTLAKIAPAIMIPALLVTYWLFYRRHKNKTEFPLADNRDKAALINYALIAVLVFMLTGNILSPQFIIWILPLVPLVNHRWRRVPWFMFLLAGILTYYLYPWHYNSFKRADAPMIYILLLRNMLLIALAGLLIAWKMPDTIRQHRSLARLPVKFIIPALVLALTVGSILYAQITLNFDNSRSGSGDMPSNGFPGSGPSNGGQSGRFPGNPREGEGGNSP